MLKIEKSGNGQAGNAAPTHDTTGLFFPQFVPIPGPLAGQMQLMLVPGSGIPMRDYFAAQALSNVGAMAAFDSSKELAQWAYRVADAMIAARKKANDSQFHEDHYRDGKDK